MKKKSLLTLSMIFILTMFKNVVVFAYPMNDDWSTNQWVGYGHQTDGNIVRCVQLLMNAAEINPGEIDGFYGPNTQNAIINYQRRHGLLADGIVGPATWSTMKNGLWLTGSHIDTNPLTGGWVGSDHYRWQDPNYSKDMLKIGFSRYYDKGNWKVMDKNAKSYPLW